MEKGGGEGGGDVRPLSQVCVRLCVNAFNTTNRAQTDDRHSASKPPAERERGCRKPSASSSSSLLL